MPSLKSDKYHFETRQVELSAKYPDSQLVPESCTTHSWLRRLVSRSARLMATFECRIVVTTHTSLPVNFPEAAIMVRPPDPTLISM